jgi:hypothetical protein
MHEKEVKHYEAQTQKSGETAGTQDRSAS